MSSATRLRGSDGLVRPGLSEVGGSSRSVGAPSAGVGADKHAVSVTLEVRSLASLEIWFRDDEIARLLLDDAFDREVFVAG